MPDGIDFAAVYRRHLPAMLAAAERILRDRHAAEDVVHDVLGRFWSGDGYDPARGDVGPYLIMVTRSRAIDWLRSRRSAERATARLAEAPAGFAVADQARVHTAGVRAAVRRLPCEQREVIALTYWAGLTVREAAEAQAIPLGTAKSRVRLGLARLAGDPDVAAA